MVDKLIQQTIYSSSLAYNWNIGYNKKEVRRKMDLKIFISILIAYYKNSVLSMKLLYLDVFIVTRSVN